MKETRRQGTEKFNSFWKNLTSGIIDKVNTTKKNISNTKQNEAGDMGEPHTPISRLNLTGMNREQAKELIGRIIDERLEEISHLELTELKIDYRERERQRARAAERINERRNRRKQRNAKTPETIITEEGIFSDFRHSSIFDVIQPETFSYEEKTAALIEGQMSILDVIAAAERSAQTAAATEFASSFDTDQFTGPSQGGSAGEEEEYYYPYGLDLFGAHHYEAERLEAGKESGKVSLFEGIHINTSLDEAVDRIFAFYEKNKARALHICGDIRQKSKAFLKDRIQPRISAGMAFIGGKLTPLFEKAEARLELRRRTAAVLAALAVRERAVSEKAARFVDLIDRINAAVIRFLIAVRDNACHRADVIRDYAERHRKKLLIEFGVAVAAAAAISIVIGNMTAYEYIYNGKALGVVKNQEDVYKTIDIIGDKLSAQYDADITIDKDKDIRFQKIIAFNQEIDDQEDILNRLTYMRDMKANGHGIYIDGKLVAILESDKTAREILDEIKDKYVKKDADIQYKKVGFAEKVEIKDVETKLGNIEAKDKALEYMMTGAVEKKIHVVQSGETFSEIAKMYGLKQSELKASNPDVIPEKLSIGQEICLNQIVPLVTVQTTEVAQYREAIPFEIKYENTANLFKNEQIVKSRGVNGEKSVVAEIVRNNGIEVSRNELSVTVLTQPVAQVVLVGTKEPPPLIGTGTFIYPVRGTLTSRFGYRWGRLHAGIDLAAPIGTHIKAADGGKVTFAGYNGALGYMVAIDHGGGRVTWYGHCSKLFVKKGDRVYQGQHIANVGNTGRSTGPHLHFEVHINDVAKNPLKYL